MKSSSDKEEFVSSLTQWKQLVYGGIPTSPGSKKENVSLSSSPEASPRLHCSPQIYVEFSPPYGRYVTLNPSKSPRVVSVSCLHVALVQLRMCVYLHSHGLGIECVL